MPTYRVTFIHARHRTGFDLTVSAPGAGEAQFVARRELAQRLQRRAGQLKDWDHTETVEIDLTTVPDKST